MTDEVTLAYLAGVIDSDGYISISQSTHESGLYFGAAVGIAGTRPQPHELAASIWGGRIHRYVPKNSRHRAQFQWSRHGDRALAIIEQIRPHLRVKREQADLAIELQELVIYSRTPLFGAGFDPVPICERMRSRMIETLNQDRRR